ncbi:C-type lectin domain family 6 member A-like [Mytilus edulis]|uniref:C-type lectin domain family 6 member A-like n=1 Tax=Mytilus edulis TaxID=6550 RepID=UPI0039EF378F
MLTFSHCVLVFCVLHLFYSQADACSHPYRKIGQSCYLIKNEKETWDTAYLRCLTYGGHLAVFETLDDLLMMSGELKKMNNRSYFHIGGRNINRHISGGDWRWIWNGKMTKMNYFAFGPRRPSGSFARPQDCLNLSSSNFYDLRCDHRQRFICEK